MKIKEETLAVCRKHWTSFLIPGFFAFVFLVGGVTELGTEAGKAMVVCGLLLVAYIALSYMNTYIAITDTRLVGHIGIIRSKTLSSPIEAVLSIGFENGLIGKIFRYHTVKINTTGGALSTFLFSHMAKAPSFVETVQNEMAKKRRDVHA